MESQRADRSSSLPPQHCNNYKARINKNPAFLPTPVHSIGRRNSTPGPMAAQFPYKGRGYSQVMSKKTEFKFGMSPLKTQKLATELVKTKPRIAKRETDRVDLEQGFGKCSLRLPKTDGQYTNICDFNQIMKKSPSSEISGVVTVDTPINTGRYKMGVGEEKTLKRSVSDLKEIYRNRRYTPGKYSNVEDIEYSGFKKVKAPATEKNGDYKQTTFDIDNKTDGNTVTRPKSLLRRSLSDIKQKSNAAKSFLSFHKAKNLEYLTKDPATIELCSDVYDKENNDDQINVKEEVFKDFKIDDTRQFGSILKRPGSKRLNIKHVEFLDNMGDEEDGIRFV